MTAAPAATLSPSELAILRDSKPIKTADDVRPSGHFDVGHFTRVLSGHGFEALRPLVFETGRIICREGDQGDAIYLVRNGTAAIVKGDFSSPLVLAHRGTGEIIGEMALLEDLPRSASVVALEPMSVIQIGRDDFLASMLSSPATDVDMLSKLSRRLRSTDDILATLSGSESRLTGRVTELASENRQLQELQRLRQQTMDLVIHDLRNPLHGIMAALDLLEISLPPEVRAGNRKFITYINASCSRLQHLVDSLIDISRMETGEMKLCREKADLLDIVKRAVEQASPALESAEIIGQMELPASMPAVEVDKSMLDRVISNLLDNAVKFTPSGGRMTISGWHESGEARIAVTDTGVGIPPEQRDHIFERFARGSNGGSARSGGFGLGLTFCRLAVEAHGGRIWVEDSPDQIGCRFVVALPLVGHGPKALKASSGTH
jgi:signal transduction histidine kinase